MAPPRRSERIARELASDPAIRLKSQHESSHVLQRLCQLVDEMATCGERESLRVAGLCCRIAGRLKTNEARAWSFGRLAAALWQVNRLEHAERAVEIALAVAPSEVKGDLFRRRSFIRIEQGRYPQALRDAKTALLNTKGVEHALALETFGSVLYYTGEYPAAIRQFSRCLKETDPDSETHYCNATHNYATALAKGTDDEVAKAIELCRELRERLRDHHKMQRAKLWWTDGLLKERLGDARGAWWSMNTARRSLIMLEAAPEVAAIVADMARVSPRLEAVRHICGEAAAVIAGHDTLARPLRTLASATREMIPEAAAALKQAASLLAPCPAL